MSATITALDAKIAALAQRDLPLAIEILKEAIRIPADYVNKPAEQGGDPLCGLSNHEGPRLQYLRDTQGYDFLMDVTAVDWSAEQSPRFTVVWHLYSSVKHAYVRVAADCPSDAEPAMASATGLWAGAALGSA